MIYFISLELIKQILGKLLYWKGKAQSPAI